MDTAGITLVKGDLRGIVRARRLSRATIGNIKQNLAFAFPVQTPWECRLPRVVFYITVVSALVAESFARLASAAMSLQAPCW